MPLYDRQCRVCGWQVTDIWEPVSVPLVACPKCSGRTERAWLTKATTIIGDEVDFVQHNGTKEPIRFRSRAEFKRWLKANDLHIRDTHIPEAGSDKSKFTRSWATYDAYTAANVKILLERAFNAPATEEAPLDMHITTYTGTMTTEQVKRYAGQ